MEVLKNANFEDTNDDLVNVFMPSFNKNIELNLNCFAGVKVDSVSAIESAKLSMEIKFAPG